MSRNYADLIQVRTATVGAAVGAEPPSRPMDPGPEPDQGPPSQFLWRGRLYVVRAILAHWFESASWWGGSRLALEGGIPPHEQEVWRVEAQPGRSSQPGVYDLCRDSGTDRWVLARSMD